jgi:cbb3-type cytochrome oxidase subunit 3
MSDSVIDILRGLVLIALMSGFLGIWIWAWRSKRKAAFKDASLMPLEEDEAARPVAHGMKKANGSKPC